VSLFGVFVYENTFSEIRRLSRTPVDGYRGGDRVTHPGNVNTMPGTPVYTIYAYIYIYIWVPCETYTDGRVLRNVSSVIRLSSVSSYLFYARHVLRRKRYRAVYNNGRSSDGRGISSPLIIPLSMDRFIIISAGDGYLSHARAHTRASLITGYKIHNSGRPLETYIVRTLHGPLGVFR